MNFDKRKYATFGNTSKTIPLAVGSGCYHTLIKVLVINVKDVAMCVERENGRIKIYSLLFIQLNVQQVSLCIVTIEI